MTVDWQTPRVVVTGATGWLGRRLVHSLLRGVPDHERWQSPQAGLIVRCLVAPDQTAGSELAGDGVEVVGGDVRDAAACQALLDGCRGAVVFHAAAVIHPRRSRDFIDVNVSGSVNVMEAARAAGARRVVAVSSTSPVGCNADPESAFDESSPYRPYMGYGRSKMLMEQHAEQLHRTGEIETVVVRAPWFYGPYQPPRQTLFFEMIRDGKAPIVGAGQNRRSMVYIDNLCQGLQLAGLSAKAAGQRYWIADERPYRMAEIIDTVEALLEDEFDIPCAHRRLRLPNLASTVARSMDRWLQAAGLYHSKIHVLSEMNQNIVCSADKAIAELGYRPQVALAEGMRRSIRWCVEQGLLGGAESGRGS